MKTEYSCTVRWIFGLAGVAAIGALSACAAIAGLDKYSKEEADASVGDASMVVTGPDGQSTSGDDSSTPTGDDAGDDGPGSVGACVDTQDDVLNCGACGSACDQERSKGAACIAGKCTYTGCGPGWLDCDSSGTNANGCETSNTSTMNCGACGAVCDSTNSVGATCAAGDGGVVSCQYTGCNAGFGDCAPAAPDTDGCETSLTTAQNCGQCGQACDTTNSTGASCPDGTTCQYTGCNSGYADCNADAPDTDGCETKVAAASCTACGGQSCDTSHSQGASCDVDAGATCQYSGCNSGYADCNSTPPDQNGCETKITTTSNCGACGRACDTQTTTGAACSGGNCTYTGCQPGQLNCDTSNHDVNGCESSSTSTTSCGACGVTCSSNTGTASCNGSTCSYQCNSGLTDCNGSKSPDTDGCECSTPACCGTGCQTTHGNGVGQNYYDCTATKTFNQSQATEACNSYMSANGGGSCSQSTTCCNGIDIVVCLGTTTSSVCGSAGGTCYCWQYQGPNPGHVEKVSGSCKVACGSSSDPTWN